MSYELIHPVECELCDDWCPSPELVEYDGKEYWVCKDCKKDIENEAI